MNLPSVLLENAVQELSRLPGVGEKTALRYVLHLLKKDKEEVMKLAQALERMRSDIQFCMQCHNISDTSLCTICSNPSRNRGTICVVENIRDLIAIENTQQFNGSYHVLGGLISPIDGVGPQDIHLETLFHRLKEQEVQEIILALSPNLQGDTTAYYIQKNIDARISLTSISRGVAFGADLEFTDKLTLGRSIVNRRPIDHYVE
jgi:recombination protein RecR